MRLSLCLILSILFLTGCGSDKEASTDAPPPSTTSNPTPSELAATPEVVEEVPETKVVAVSAPDAPVSQSPKRIRFAKGTYSGTESGSLSDGSIDDYVLWARADQVMTIDLSASGTSAYLVILKDGYIMTDPSNDWSGDLQETGDYHVRVFLSDDDASAGASASYSMVIEIR